MEVWRRLRDVKVFGYGQNIGPSYGGGRGGGGGGRFGREVVRRLTGVIG